LLILGLLATLWVAGVLAAATVGSSAKSCKDTTVGASSSEGVADHALDCFGRGDIYLVVPPDRWSRANKTVENRD
jgi:hypothetical protein